MIEINGGKHKADDYRGFCIYQGLASKCVLRLNVFDVEMEAGNKKPHSQIGRTIIL